MKQRNESTLLSNAGEILTFLRRFDLRSLMLAPTRNELLQFCRYCFVGGVATVVDWAVLYCIEGLGVHYLLAEVAGFVCGLACNFTLSKYMVFNGSDAKVDAVKEFLAYAAIGVSGLIITLVLMFIMTEWLHLHFMMSKVISTVLVLVWNFLGRKVLYQ